jgi:ribonuclease HII
VASSSKPIEKKPAFVCGGRYERAARAGGYRFVAGVDEAGRGAIFGPVFAAAVILDPIQPIRGLRDSKLLDPERRQVLAGRIRERALAWAVGTADVYEIDRVNILQASRRAMRRAIEKLSPGCDYLLIDAVEVDSPLPQMPIIHGDALCQSIAAASILAKTARDQCMLEWDAVFPHLGLCRHKGYGTDEHCEAISKFGPTLMHRFSFEPVRLACPYVIWTGYDQNEKAGVEHANA